jgi:hypothetical protein
MTREDWLRCWGYVDGTPEADEAWAAKQAFETRSLDPVQVIPDIDGYVSPIDGKFIGSRSEHRDHMKRHGVIELGNDKPKLGGFRPSIPREQIRAEIKDTVERMKAHGTWREV